MHTITTTQSQFVTGPVKIKNTKFGFTFEIQLTISFEVQKL